MPVGKESKPLYIFLKREYWEQFFAKTKPGMEEFRPFGKRWNERVCYVGRPVFLCLGYSGPRMQGVIAGFRVDEAPTETEAWRACGYAAKHPGVPAACIRITDAVLVECIKPEGSSRFAR